MGFVVRTNVAEGGVAHRQTVDFNATKFACSRVLSLERCRGEGRVALHSLVLRLRLDCVGVVCYGNKDTMSKRSNMVRYDVKKWQ